MKKAIAIFENLYRNARLLSCKKNTRLYLSTDVTLSDLYNIRKIVNNKIDTAVTDYTLGAITQQELEDELDTLMVIINSLSSDKAKRPQDRTYRAFAFDSELNKETIVTVKAYTKKEALATMRKNGYKPKSQKCKESQLFNYIMNADGPDYLDWSLKRIPDEYLKGITKTY